MNRGYFLVWVILISSHALSAQDQTNFTQFFLNPYLINPSYAGIDGKPSLTFTYRKQWTSIKDAPQISNFTFHSPVSRRVSFALSATDDQKGLLHNSGLMLSFGYNVPLSTQSYFRFGISGGISSNSVDLDRLEGFTDIALANLLDNHMSVGGNAGISFHLSTFHAGVSLPVIFQPSYISKDAFSITEIDPFQSLIFHFSNRFYFNNNKHVFEPYALYRMTTGLPPQYEVAGILHLNHLVWVGASHKQDFGISALGGIKLKNTLALGVSYSLKNTGVNELNSPTYEVSIGLLLGKNRKETQVYSFVNTEKEKQKKGTGKSASEMIAQKRKQEELARKNQLDAAAKKKQQEELARKQQEVNAQKQKELEKRKQEEELRKQQALTQQQKPAVNTTTSPKENPPANNTVASNITPKTQEEEVAKKQQQVNAQRLKDEEQRKQQEENVRRQQEEARKKADELAARKKEEDALKSAQQLKKEEKQPEQYTSTIRQDTIVVKHKPRFNHIDATMEVLNVEVTEHNEQDEKERISRLTLHAQDPDEHHSDTNHPNGERHEFVKRGNHKAELKLADYVVSGVFKNESNAKQFADGLKKLGFKANYGHLTEKGIWYVYLFQGNDINAARTQRDNFRKMKIFRDAWLLTVHP